MLQLFHNASELCSRAVTKTYSTSFSSAIRLLHKDLRAPVFNIYGFVRLADEIVDSFHTHDKQSLLDQFREETTLAIKQGISLNPILHSFQRTVNEHAIDLQLIETFFKSMEQDLSKQKYDVAAYQSYIDGSAESVGLMCLKVFCGKDALLYDRLTPAARSLGAAFQKVNFLRDMQADYHELSRTYFPGCDFNNFTPHLKQEIESDICQDFKKALEGILKLPLKARLGVYVAYKYYMSLFGEIRKMEPAHVLESRIRIPNYRKALIVLRAGIKSQLRLI